MSQTIDYEKLANALVSKVSTKAVSSTATATYSHGPGGLLSPLGMSQYIFNAMILPFTGLERILPKRPTNETDPLYGIITGTTATSGDQPTGQCDDPKTAGLLKICTQSAVLGHIGLETQVANLKRFGERVNRGEFLDFTLVGNPLMEGQAPTMPAVGAFGGMNINDSVVKAAFELASSWVKEYGPLLYSGNPTNNTAGGGYEEFRGFEQLVNTGYQDAVTGQACAAADSIVESFGNNNITSAEADIVGKIQDIFFRLRHIAGRAGMGNVRWVIAMPLGMFYRLSEVWGYYEVARALDGLTFNTTFQVHVDGAAVTSKINEFRGNLQSRTGQFLMIDGQRVDVILDDNIPETEVTPGVFSSDIYIIPLTATVSPEPLTYMEFYNWDTPNGAFSAAQKLAPGDSYYVTDGGMYFWHKKPPTNLCVQVAVWAQPRLILRTPYLAARITNVAWAPLTVAQRSPFNSSGYFVDGGNQNYNGFGPSYYPPTS